MVRYSPEAVSQPNPMKVGFIGRWLSPPPYPIYPIYAGRWWDCTLCPWKERAQISYWALQHSTWKNLGQQLRVSVIEQGPECRSHKSISSV